MACGCEDAGKAMADGQATTLKWVLGINAVMFFVEFSFGILAASSALLADSLDMLGDTLVYSFSLYVVSRDDSWKARAAYFKGGIMLLFGLFVLAEAFYKILFPVIPSYSLMGSIGFLALVMNAVCLFLLTRHRDDDVNMRSVWLCSRNDIIANVSVLGAGAAVLLSGSQWPDVLVGLAIAGLFIRSSAEVFADARKTQLEFHNAV